MARVGFFPPLRQIGGTEKETPWSSYTRVSCGSARRCGELTHEAGKTINTLHCNEWDRWWDRWTGRKSERQVCRQHSWQRDCQKTEKGKGARYDEKVSPPHQKIHRQDAGKNAWKDKWYPLHFCTLFQFLDSRPQWLASCSFSPDRSGMEMQSNNLSSRFFSHLR